MDLINHKTIPPSSLVDTTLSSTLYEEASIYYSKFLTNLGSVDLTDKSFPFFYLNLEKDDLPNSDSSKKLFLGVGSWSHGREAEN